MKWRFCGKKRAVQQITKMYTLNNQCNTFGQCAGHCKSTKVYLPFCETTLSTVACLGTGSTDLSHRTCRLLPRGKCRDFPRFWCTSPRGLPGHQLHSHLSSHQPFLSPGKVPGIPTILVHFHPWLAGLPAPQTPLAALAVSTPRGKCREFPRFWCTSPRGMRLSGRSSRACLGKYLVYRHSEKEHLLDLG